MPLTLPTTDQQDALIAQSAVLAGLSSEDYVFALITSASTRMKGDLVRRLDTMRQRVQRGDATAISAAQTAVVAVGDTPIKALPSRGPVVMPKLGLG